MKYLLLFYPEKSGFFSMPWLQFIPEVKLGKIENTVHDKKHFSFHLGEMLFIMHLFLYT